MKTKKLLKAAGIILGLAFTLMIAFSCVKERVCDCTTSSWNSYAGQPNIPITTSTHTIQSTKNFAEKTCYAIESRGGTSYTMAGTSTMNYVRSVTTCTLK